VLCIFLLFCWNTIEEKKGVEFRGILFENFFIFCRSSVRWCCGNYVLISNRLTLIIKLMLSKLFLQIIRKYRKIKQATCDYIHSVDYKPIVAQENIKGHLDYEFVNLVLHHTDGFKSSYWYPCEHARWRIHF